MKRPPPDRIVQRFDANTYPLDGGMRLLEASAGTGKTFALAHLTLRLITEASCPLERVLVVTYTEAAADELRSRIGHRLQDALLGLEAMAADQPLPDQDPVLAAWWDRAPEGQVRQDWISRLLIALEQLDQADITTIHGFCRRSLRRLAIGTGAALEPQLETDAAELIEQVVQDIWRRELLTLPPGQLQGLHQASLSSQQLIQVLLQIDADPHPHLHRTSDDFDAEQPLAEQLDASLQVSWDRFRRLWFRDGQSLESCFCSAAQQWRAQGCKDTKPYSAKPRTDRCAQVDQWIEEQLRCPDLGTIRSFEKPLRDYFHPGIWCRAARKAGEEAPSLAAAELQQAIADLWDGPVERVWRYCLQRSLLELAEQRRRRGVITFAGLLAAMDPGDGDHTWLQPLRQRYQAVMVDEFQDTDPLQWRLLHRAFASDSRHLLLMVGDPKQAIYRFRGGDLSTYLQARAQVQRIDNLLDNYRTTAPLMHGLNALMQPGLVQSDLEVPPVEPRSTHQAAVLDEGIHPLQVLVPEDDSMRSKTELEDTLPEALAEVVVTLLLQQPGLKPAQICLLVSRHDQASDLRRALAQRGVPTRLVNQGDVLDSEAALVLQRFLDALAQPGDDRSLRLLACSPLLGWTPDQLREAANGSGLDQLAQRLQFWIQQFPRLGLLGCLSDLLDGRLMADLSERGRLLGDLQQAARLVQEAIHRQGLDIASAASWLRRQRLHPPALIPSGRLPHSDQAESAVAVVTVHRSKGLEYPVVICPYLWQAPREVKGPLWRQTAEGGWCVAVDRHWGVGQTLAQQADHEAAAEAERLAYVAVTRACSQLVLVWAKGRGQELSPLRTWLFGEDHRSSSMRNLPLTLARLPQEAGNQRWRSAPVKDDLRIGATPARIDRSWGRSSYSAWIASPLDAARLELGRDGDPDAVEAPELSGGGIDAWPERGPLADFPRGSTAGDCLHRILEQLPFQLCSEKASEQASALIDSELRRAGLQEEWGPAVLKGLEQVLTTPLGGPLGNMQLAELTPDRRLHELSFDLPVRQARTADLMQAFRLDPQARFSGDYLPYLANLQVNSRGFLTGSIDLVFCDQVDPRNGRWWVADWKSNWIGERGSEGVVSLCGPRHYDDAAMQAQMLDHHYPLQAHLYLVALHRHLRWRLPGYRPERHLGGYLYVFLRGMPGEAGWSSDRPGPGRIVERAPLERVLALDSMLQERA